MMLDKHNVYCYRESQESGKGPTYQGNYTNFGRDTLDLLHPLKNVESAVVKMAK